MDIAFITYPTLVTIVVACLLWAGIAALLVWRWLRRQARSSETSSEDRGALPNIPRPIDAPPLKVGPPPTINYSAPPCPQCGKGHLCLDFKNLVPNGWRCRDCSNRWPFAHLNIVWEDRRHVQN